MVKRSAGIRVDSILREVDTFLHYTWTIMSEDRAVYTVVKAKSYIESTRSKARLVVGYLEDML
jgi:hypothetical protein